MSILITGGTGSFSQAFVDRCLKDNLYDRICIYSRGEAKQAEMRERFCDDMRLRFFVGDIRDRERLSLAMKDVDTVIHSAAMKRIDAAFYNPTEVIKSNILGTVNVVEEAAKNNVKKVLALSTDKAWRAQSIYGQSKALMESIIFSANHVYGEGGPQYSCVRYGNILCSNSSVIPKWRDALKKGTKIKVTDLNCTRFSMFQEEAVQLVLDTLGIMPKDKPAIPILPAYSLKDLLEAMEISEYEIIGLPDFEKLHEGMEDGNTSDKARRLSVGELKSILEEA